MYDIEFQLKYKLNVYKNYSKILHTFIKINNFFLIKIFFIDIWLITNEKQLKLR